MVRLGRLLTAIGVAFAALPGGLGGSLPAHADGGDYSLDFVAAAPFTYDHATGGGAFNDRTIGKSADVVESLEGGDFACDEIVTYLTHITVDDLSAGRDPHGVETIQVEYAFGAEATNGGPVGHIDVVGAVINDGAVVNGAGPGGTDGGMSDDLGSTATIVSEQYTSGATPDGSYPNPQEDELLLAVTIDDLESFETVVLRIDVRLGCSPMGGSGNIQAKLDGKRVVAADGAAFDDAIPGGAQTIPFKSFASELSEPPLITVIKSNDADADGVFTDTETAGDVPATVTYQVEIRNDSAAPAVIESVDDDIHDISGSTCAALVGTVVAAGQTLTCTFDVPFADDNQTVTNVFTATGINQTGSSTGSDDSTVIIPDLLPAITLEKNAAPGTVPETGGDVTFTVSVTNQSGDELTLDSLVDDIFGDLNGVGDCAVPQTLAADGGSYSCSFTNLLSGDSDTSHHNTINGSASDDDGNGTSADDDATVSFVEVLPSIGVTKTANLAAVPETGADVTFTVVVTNTAAEAATLDALVDDVFGDLDGVGDCSVPQTLAASGGSYECSFTEFLSGDPAEPHVNTVTVTASDDDGNETSDEDDATVTFGDLVPAIDVTKDTSSSRVLETGADVTFTVTVDNIGPTSVTLTSLIDDVYGDLDGLGTCSTSQTLDSLGGSYTCSFTEFVSGTAGVSHVNVVTGSGVDEHGDDVAAFDDATVDFDPVIDLEVTKTAEPDLVTVGETSVFTLTVVNQGPSAASGVVLEDVAAPELTYVADTGEGAFDPGTGLWAVGVLGVGERREMLLTMTVDDAGEFINTLEVVAADQPDIDSVPGDGEGDDYDEVAVAGVIVLASGLIGDTVWFDEDGDGIVDDDESGIADAIVYLQDVATGEVTETTTNEDGMYLFAALDEGEYVVTSPSLGGDLKRTTPGSFEVSLGDGEAFLAADFGWRATLPQTGLELGTFSLVGFLMLLAGVALELSVRRRVTQRVE